MKRRKTRSTNLIVGAAMIALLVLTALLADVVAPYAYDDAVLTERFTAPCAAHPFGTDAYGRDVLSRVVYGSRIALKIALVSVSIQMVIGLTAGLLAGFYGGAVDRVLCFVMDITWSMPPLVMAFAVISVLGKTLDNAIVAIALVSWAQYARIARSKTMAVRNMPFLETGLAFGESDFALIFHYILPNIIPSIIVVASLSIPRVIMSTTSLSFLGLGAQSPSPDWGLALSESMQKIGSAPWLAVFPGLALVFTTFGFTMLGEGVRDLLDPRMRKR